MTDKKPLKINIQSEIGDLEAVLLHTPGAEVENMTPKMAQRALYSDILNLSIAQEEYKQLSGVLSRLAKVYSVHDLLVKVLDNEVERQALVGKICVMEQVTDYFDMLMEMSSARLAKVLIEGLPAKINTLTSFLNEDYYALFPLYNFYFTRDAAVTIGDNALICKMANKVRMRESLIMEAIYKGSGEFECGIINAYDHQPGNTNLYMEGGDILIARDDILLIGNGMRTSTYPSRHGIHPARQGQMHGVRASHPGRQPVSDSPHHHGERQGGQDQQRIQHSLRPAQARHGSGADHLRR